LIVGDEDYISDEDKEDEVTNQYVDFLREVECGDWNIESHDDETEHHLIDEDQVENEIDPIDLETKHFEASVVILPQSRLLFL
jgi:hypothetical protein